MTGIGAPMDNKENTHKNEVRRKKKVGGGRKQDLVRIKRKILVFS
jgi:hypothetical protein